MEFPSLHRVVGIATQGRHSVNPIYQEWVTEYKVKLDDGSGPQYMLEGGNPRVSIYNPLS